jgi:hypothetical protein
MASFGLLARMARRPEDRSYGRTDVDGDRAACRASGDLKKGCMATVSDETGYSSRFVLDFHRKVVL